MNSGVEKVRRGGKFRRNSRVVSRRKRHWDHKKYIGDAMQICCEVQLIVG